MENLFCTVQTVQPQMSKQNIRHKFTVDKALAEMEIRFSYTPKKMENEAEMRALALDCLEQYAPGEYKNGYAPLEAYLPLVNLITLSLDDPNGYRGCAHRHDPVRVHKLTANSASPGFFIRDLPCGEWEAVVSLHAVITDCTYTLEIFGREAVL